MSPSLPRRFVPDFGGDGSRQSHIPRHGPCSPDAHAVGDIADIKQCWPFHRFVFPICDADRPLDQDMECICRLVRDQGVGEQLRKISHNLPVLYDFLYRKINFLQEGEG